MARKARIWWPGASYHIMIRGNHRLEIFRDDEDRQYFLSVLAQVQEKYPFHLHAYCLMTNHVHFELETADIELGKIMKMINMRYAIYFNKKYRFVGQLLQGRFRSETIMDDRYFLSINRYIHLNPVKAHIVADPKEYPWSSYPIYLRGGSSALVQTDKILAHFHPPKRDNYETFVLRGLLHGEGGFELPSVLEMEEPENEESRTFPDEQGGW